MKIQYCSDLHLEFEQNNKFLRYNFLKKTGDILILAGDIFPLHENNFKDEFFNMVSMQYDKVFWLPGNHEFYHCDLASFGSSFKIKLNDKIEILYNYDFYLEEVHFIFSPLWSKISTKKAKIIEQYVSDFHCILINDKRIKISDFNFLHTESLSFIEKAILKKSSKRIIITHHLPSNQCNATIHKKSNINEAFCVDVENIILNSNANFWIYGHSHFNQKPLIIGKTMLITNQLGYLHHSEHYTFKNNAYFSI